MSTPTPTLAVSIQSPPSVPVPIPSTAVQHPPAEPPASPRTYCLNAGQFPPDLCTNGARHTWAIIHQPPGAYSGWHEERCTHCGIIQCYDTSD